MIPAAKTATLVGDLATRNVIMRIFPLTLLLIAGLCQAVATVTDGVTLH